MLKMRSLFLALVLAPVALGAAPQPSQPAPDQRAVIQHFAQLALGCVHKEYPNIIRHKLASDADVKPPRELYAAFYGCYDWHSSVHGHWLLVRLLNTHLDDVDSAQIIAALSQSFAPEKVAAELAQLTGPSADPSFERPYGIAWFLQLTAELRQSDSPQARAWLETLKPLESPLVENFSQWLTKLSYPIRSGEHSQTAFAFGLALDWSRIAGNGDVEALLLNKVRHFYAGDVDCPIEYEPSGHDFLSPCLAEADLMRRVMDAGEYASWLTAFFPTLPADGPGDWMSPVTVTDKSDGKLAHLDGLNLSRAWMLEGIASALSIDDKRRGALLHSAQLHRRAGIDAVTNNLHYMGSHWLGSFATYLQTQRGIVHRPRQSNNGR